MQLELASDPTPRPRRDAGEGLDAALPFLEALSLAPIGVALLDRDLRFVHVNAWRAEWTGVSAEALLGRTLAEAFPGDERETSRAEERMRAALETGAVLTCTFGRDLPGGARQEWLATFVPVPEAAAGPGAVFAIVVDITADRARAEAEARARMGAERAARRIASALELTAALSAASDVATVAELILDRARVVVGADLATLRIVRGERLELLGASAGSGATPPLPALPLVDAAPVAEAVRRGEPIWLEDRDAMARRFPEAEHLAGRTVDAAVVLPLAARGRTFGALTLTFASERAFDLEERAVVLALAEPCAQALDRALRHDRERVLGASAVSARNRAVQLQAVTAAVSAARTVPEVAAAAVAHAGSTLGANAAGLYTLSPDRRSAVLAHQTRLGVPDAFERLPLGDSLPVTDVLRSGAAVSWASRAEAIGRWPVLGEALRLTERCAVLPLAARGETLGALVLGWREGGAFEADELDLVGAVANACAQALDRAAAYEAERDARAAAERATARAQRLLAVTTRLSGAATPEEVAAVLAAEARAELGVTSSVTYVLERGGASLRIAGAAGDAEVHRDAIDHLPVDFPAPAAVVARTGEPVWIGSGAELAAAFPRFADRFPYTARFGALAVLPLRVRREVLGSVAFAYAAERAFPPDDRALLSAVAELAAQALDRARLVERERAALAAESRANALLEQIVESAPLGIGFLDRDLRYRVVNPALAEMNGLPASSHLGKTPRELFSKLPMDEIETALRGVRDRSEAIRDLEITGETPGRAGKRTWLESWYPLRSGGEVLGVALLVREVTQEREANQFQRHVLGIVGHDLRNPLAAIVTATSTLRRAAVAGAPDARLLGRIATSAERIREIVDTLLDFVRVREGGVPLRRTPCDLAQVARAAAEECEAAHPGRAVACEAHGDCRGEWDPNRMAQVVTNLLVNALAYGPPDAPVRLACHGAGDEVGIEIANAGPPIPPEVLPRLFEPFQRGSGLPSRGLGLGLFIARAIVAAHGGRIACRSGAQEGTVFSVHLPRARG